MKRDMELIRKILLAVEISPPDEDLENLTFEGYKYEEIQYHAWLLINAGLAQGFETHPGYSPGPVVRSLTWAGHEFLDTARDERRWKKVTGTLLEKCV